MVSVSNSQDQSYDICMQIIDFKCETIRNLNVDNTYLCIYINNVNRHLKSNFENST